jgi:hypothetical protein
MALSGRTSLSAICPLSGAKRTFLSKRVMSAPDPKRTYDVSPANRLVRNVRRVSRGRHFPG